MVLVCDTGITTTKLEKEVGGVLKDKKNCGTVHNPKRIL